MINQLPEWIDSGFRDLADEITFKEGDDVSINFEALDKDKDDEVKVEVD